MGYTLEHGDSEALKNTILEAYDNRENLSNMGKNARCFSEQHTARKIQTKKYFEELKKLL